MKISKTINSYVAGLENFKQGQSFKLGDVTYSLDYDPESFKEVLLMFSEEDGENSIQFACTDFGIYLREEGAVNPSHYFYHTLMYTLDFGFTLNDLANVHYIFKEMKNS